MRLALCKLVVSCLRSHVSLCGLFPVIGVCFFLLGTFVFLFISESCAWIWCLVYNIAHPFDLLFLSRLPLNSVFMWYANQYLPTSSVSLKLSVTLWMNIKICLLCSLRRQLTISRTTKSSFDLRTWENFCYQLSLRMCMGSIILLFALNVSDYAICVSRHITPH